MPPTSALLALADDAKPKPNAVPPKNTAAADGGAACGEPEAEPAA